MDELPIQIYIRPLDKAVNVTWEKPKCNSRSGRLIYNIAVSNDKFHFLKKIELQDSNSYYIGGLRPFTHFNLTISIARNGRNLAKNVLTKNLTYEFITLPGGKQSITNE